MSFGVTHGFLWDIGAELLSIFDVGLMFASFFMAIMYIIILSFKPFDKEAKEQKVYLLKSELDHEQWDRCCRGGRTLDRGLCTSGRT
jgi:hypothetical protein